MVIRSADSGVLIDLAVNAPPDLPASATPAGPTLAPEELAGNKLLALFDRAAARDFADVYGGCRGPATGGRLGEPLPAAGPGHGSW